MSTRNRSSDHYGTVRIIRTASNASLDSSDFLATASSGSPAGVTTTSATQRGTILREVEAKNGDMEQHRIQQEQALGAVDTRLEVTMARRTSPKMDRLDDA